MTNATRRAPASSRKPIILRMLLLAITSSLLLVDPSRYHCFAAAESTTDAPAVKPTLSVIDESVKHLLHDFKSSATLAGSFKPLLSKLWLHDHELDLFLKSVRTAINWEDILLIAVAGWLTVPAIEWPYKQLRSFSNTNNNPSNSDDDVDNLATKTKETLKAFRKTWMFTIADHVQQIAKIALAIYIVDICKLLTMAMGFTFWKLGALPHAFAQTAYCAWGINRMSHFKRHSLRKYVSRRPETWGRMQIVNRLVDAALYGGGLLIIFNILQVQMGVAMHSLLAFGSVGTLAAGLASQGVAKEILHGLMLASSDRLYEGDTVRFNNGVSGTIVQLGWMETVLRGSDEIMLSIPNTEVVTKQVSNLSRARYSQVKQTLLFKYSDAPKLISVMADIKEEIQLACPELIADGTRPFRVYWSSYEKSHLEVQVDAHFRIRPIGDDYWENRQRVMESIDRAVKKHDVEFALAK